MRILNKNNREARKKFFFEARRKCSIKATSIDAILTLNGSNITLIDQRFSHKQKWRNPEKPGWEIFWKRSKKSRTVDCGECFPSVSPFKWAGGRLLWIWLVFTIYCTAPYLSSSSENPLRIINCRVGSRGEEISRNPSQKSWAGNMGKYWWAATSAPPPLGPRDQLSSSGLGTGLLGPKDQTAPNKTPPCPKDMRPSPLHFHSPWFRWFSCRVKIISAWSF